MSYVICFAFEELKGLSKELEALFEHVLGEVNEEVDAFQFSQIGNRHDFPTYYVKFTRELHKLSR